MIPRSLKSFISRLHKETDEGSLAWNEGAPGAYFCNHKSFELHIRYGFDHDAEEGFYVFLLKSASGDAAFTVTSDEVDFPIMRNLYESVTVRAAGFDDLESKFFD